MRRAALWIALVALAAGCGRPTDAPGPTPEPLGVTLRAPTPAPRATHSVEEQPLLPTALSAPTPTPVIHIVQPGETLIDIAQAYGVTLDALQAANGVLNPETLQIGQQLIIPLGPGAPSTSGGGLLLPTPAPLPVSVQGTALYETPVGSIVVQGEILNTSGAALENTQVRVALLNESGEEVAAATAFTALEVIPIGGKSPFGVLFAPSGLPFAKAGGVPPGVASFVVTPIRAEASTEPGRRYMPIVVTNQEGAVDVLQFKVRGSVANQGSATATGVNVVLTTYDDTGRVTGFRQSIVGDGTLPAGATAEFEISLAPNSPHGLPTADYTLAAQGQAAQP